MDPNLEKNIMMALTFIFPIILIVISRWILPSLEKRFGEKSKTIYYVAAFVLVMVFWYLVDTHYGVHMGLW